MAREPSALAPAVKRAGPGGTLASAAALVALVVPIAWMLVLAGRPLDTNDLWFHLKMGETYWTEGPWPASDPMLHTARPGGPVQHEWLFGVAVFGAERAFGFQGLRLLHVACVAAILWLVAGLFVRESGSLAGACLATGVFVALAWWRLIQLRPDLVSIAATILVARWLLLPDGGPSRGRIAAGVVLLVLWANAHSLFAIGLALLAVACGGLLVRARLWRAVTGAGRASELAALDRRAAKGVLAALALGGVATLANPRGIAQHLTFFTSSSRSAIWSVTDEWQAFDPFSRHYDLDVSWLAWVATDLLLVATAAAALAALVALLRRPSERALRVCDPLTLALAAAAIVGMVVSIRFLWLCVFPLLFLLRAARCALAERPRAQTVAHGLSAAAAVAVCLAFPGPGGARLEARRLPATPSEYLGTAVASEIFPIAGVRFLAEAGLEGRLFNGYAEGGFLGYWLAPSLRTFIDGRTEHYGPEVLEEESAVSDARGAREGESFLDLLDRRGVDVFFGIGLPGRQQIRSGQYTSAHLEGADGWIPIFRTLDQAIYLRRNARNRVNLERVAAFYAREGVPFDRERGFDAGEVVRARPDWAIAHRLLPKGGAELRAMLDSPDPRARAESVRALALVHMLLGAHAVQLELEERLLAQEPRAEWPRRRRIAALLRLDRMDEAVRESDELLRLDPNSEASRLFAMVARSARDERLRLGASENAVALAAARAGLHRLPLMSSADAAIVQRGGLVPLAPPPRPAPLR